jgi:hypothetical protein
MRRRRVFLLSSFLSVVVFVVVVVRGVAVPVARLSSARRGALWMDGAKKKKGEFTSELFRVLINVFRASKARRRGEREEEEKEKKAPHSRTHF